MTFTVSIARSLRSIYNIGQWLVARVCSEYIQYCQRGVANGSISKSHHDNTVRWLNDLCSYCGAMRVAKLKKGHVKDWIESHPGLCSAFSPVGQAVSILDVVVLIECRLRLNSWFVTFGLRSKPRQTAY